jgi:iron complex transport system substrate-binding protein
MFEQNSITLPIFIYDQANKLYPELFSFDIEKLIKNSFSTYFDYDLTDEQVDYMLTGLTPQGTNMYDGNE